MVAEAEEWLADSRDYQGYKRREEWSSLIDDFTVAVATCGPRLAARTPGLPAVAGQLHKNIGQDPSLRSTLLNRLRFARADLASGAAAVDAFDDLYEAVSDPSTTVEVIMGRLQCIRACFASANRSLSTLSYTLAGIADDSAREIAIARHELDGAELSQSVRELSDDGAGTTTVERLSLMRRLVAHPPPVRHQVVWVFYGHARCEPMNLNLGPVTFIDGPNLLGAFNSLKVADGEPTSAATNSWLAIQLPEELLDSEEGAFLRADHLWPKLDHWVAARVDLGQERHSDPVAAARHQADALVGLAKFNTSGSSWTALTGHLHIVDGRRRGGSWPIREPVVRNDGWLHLDRTDTWLRENQSDLAVYLPINDLVLTELVESIDILNATETSTAAIASTSFASAAARAGSGSGAGSAAVVAFLQRVRVLELMASRMTVKGLEWTRLVEGHLAEAWVREQLLARIFAAAEGAAGNGDLRAHDMYLTVLGEELRTHHDRHLVMHRDVALHSLAGLAGRLPEHHLVARRVRDIAGRVRDVQSLHQWVDELRAEHAQLVGRARRCRNSLIHGGPFSASTLSTVSSFTAWHAGLATVTALRGALEGAEISDSLERKRVELATWATRLANTTVVADGIVST